MELEQFAQNIVLLGKGNPLRKKTCHKIVGCSLGFHVHLAGFFSGVEECH